MFYFIIEADGEIKEAFHYGQPISEPSKAALREYAKASYGDAAALREMMASEVSKYLLLGPAEFIKTRNEQAPLK